MAPTGAWEGSVYLLTVTSPKSRAWQIAGIFLDPASATNAKTYLIEKGVNAQFIDIDRAPIGFVNLAGIDEPYEDSLKN